VNRLIQEYALSEKNRAGWQEQANQISFPDPWDEQAVSQFIGSAGDLARAWLPSGIQTTIRNLDLGGHSAALVIRNLPIDEKLPPVPTSGYRPLNKAAAVSEAVLLGVGSLYGPPFTYKQEKKGRMPAEVTPIVGYESTQSNASRQDLHAHSDDQFLRNEHLPEALLLYGLVSSEAETIVYPAEEIVALLPKEVLEELQKPNFQIKAPASFDFGGYEIWSPPRPLFTCVDNTWHVGVSTRPATRAINAEALQAYEYLLKVLNGMQGRRFVIGAGALLGFSNLRVLHARTAFEGPRWLQRCYVRKSVDSLREATGSGPFTYAFDSRLLIQ
jgi:L-asparagine oxygenase